MTASVSPSPAFSAPSTEATAVRFDLHRLVALLPAEERLTALSALVAADGDLFLIGFDPPAAVREAVDAALSDNASLDFAAESVLRRRDPALLATARHRPRQHRLALLAPDLELAAAALLDGRGSTLRRSGRRPGGPCASSAVPEPCGSWPAGGRRVRPGDRRGRRRLRGGRAGGVPGGRGAAVARYGRAAAPASGAGRGCGPSDRPGTAGTSPTGSTGRW
ncbi:hypothetical protein ACIGXM_10235 [Kitasatospora sp. NPDC052896]|uniref:hypothetical protein n=1 Tax=Kitasatospora sp. NPDC052896 TaxID=3364061 RepID=UPI0037C63833